MDAYLDDDIRNRAGQIWFGVVSERAGNELIGEPFCVYEGFMDAMRDTMEDEGGEIKRVITVEVANGPSQIEFTSLFHTDEDQRRAYPTDTAGRLVINSEARLLKLTWPE
jgi:hypothetical protein